MWNYFTLILILQNVTYANKNCGIDMHNLHFFFEVLVSLVGPAFYNNRNLTAIL
jgi:hypothetical protein